MLQRLPLAAGLLLALWLLVAVSADGQRMLAIALLGIAIGAVLYHAPFGFTSSWRLLLQGRESSGVQAQLLMLALACVAFAPLLASGNYGGAWAPAGVSVAVGAALFGVGMQLAGGCGSGTLYALGNGNLRMAAALLAFVGGSFLASLHTDYWYGLPALDGAPLGERMGWWQAAALQLAILALLAWRLRRAFPASRPGRAALLAAALLAGLNLAMLWVSGHPWTITWAYTLWGGKLAALAGWSAASSDFWMGSFARQALNAPLLTDDTTVSNIGIVLGAALSASFAGRFQPWRSARPGALFASIIGGLLMGYGARIAFGCNVGAFFSGIASTSLHGWLWIACALPGCWLGLRLRPLFGLRDQ